MGKGITVLVLSNRQIWRDSLVMSAQTVVDKVYFLTQETSPKDNQKIDSVLIDVHGLPHNTIKRKIEKHWELPVFILQADGKQTNFEKGQNVIGVFSGGMAMCTLVQSIKMTLDKAETVSIPRFDKGQLSIAEEMILDGIIKGHSNKQIARFYGINISKVKYCLQQVYRKLEVNNRVQAALIASQFIV